MKLLFKPFKILFVFIFSILLIPLIILGLLWRPVSPPDHYKDEAITVENRIMKSIDDFIEEDTDRTPLSFSLNAQAINNEIRNQLIAQMEEANEESDYLIDQNPVLIQGVWVSMKKDTINITMGIHVDTSILIFKSRVLLSFEIVDTEGIVELKLKKLTIGNLPLAWASNFANSLIKRVSGQDIEATIQNELGDLGEFDLKKRTLKVDLRNLANQMEEHKELVVTLIDLIYDNDLLSFGINKANDEFAFGLTLNLNKLEDQTPALEIPNHLKINNEVELELFLKQQIDLDETKLMNTLLSNKPEFRLTSIDINRVLDYFIRTNLEDNLNNELARMEVYENYEFIVNTPYLEILDNYGSVNVPVILRKTGGKEFRSMLKLKTSITTLGNDLILNINSITMGELILDDDFITKVMESFPVDNEFITGTTFVLKDFTQYFDQFGLKFNNITFENTDLVLQYEIEGLNDALADIVNNPLINQDIKDKVDELLNDIDNEETINELIDLINDLSEEERQTLLDELQSALSGLIND